MYSAALVILRRNHPFTKMFYILHNIKYMENPSFSFHCCISVLRSLISENTCVQVTLTLSSWNNEWYLRSCFSNFYLGNAITSIGMRKLNSYQNTASCVASHVIWHKRISCKFIYSCLVHLSPQQASGMVLFGF